MDFDISRYDARAGWMRAMEQEAGREEQIDRGRLKVEVVSNENLPIEGAKVEISYPNDPDRTMEELVTDSSGNTPVAELTTPPLEYSMEPSPNRPYSEYTIRVTAPGFEPVDVTGSELLPDSFSIQPVKMRPAMPGQEFENFVIPDHTLYGEYPPKDPEAEIKPISESGEIVLSRVVVPEFVVVHDGPPSDGAASDYYVRYKDYIKNVACSEIYATWPEDTIRANVLAILSFTMNRVYTEW